MSLHAQITPEAQAALDAQKRNSTISAVIISLLVCALLVVILLYLTLTSFLKKTPEIISYAPGTSEEETIEKPEMTNQVERKPSAPSSSMAKVIASSNPSPTAVPVPDIEVTEPSLDFGSGDDFGDGWGNGDGDGTGGGGFGNLPSSMKKRCSKAERLQRLAKEGGKPECEDAVMASLRWMQSTQSKDGSWTTGNHKVGMTGLALLAYLGHCETPNSAEFGNTVHSAIVYLVGVGMKNGGRLATDTGDKHWPYEHSIATYALAEAYTFCSKQNINIPNLKETVSEAGNFIIGHQHSHSGAWDYNYDQSGKRGGDSSIVCWHLQALKACKHTGLDFPRIKSSAGQALDYLEKCQKSNGGVYYTPNSGAPYATMTGGAMLCFQQWNKGSRALVRQGSKYIRKEVKFGYDTADADLYAHYYYGQAMMNRGGAEWRDYNDMFVDELLENQNDNGSWKSPGGNNKIKGIATSYAGGGTEALHYRTCLCTLMLEVYYRFLPGTSGK